MRRGRGHQEAEKSEHLWGKVTSMLSLGTAKIKKREGTDRC